MVNEIKALIKDLRESLTLPCLLPREDTARRPSSNIKDPGLDLGPPSLLNFTNHLVYSILL